MRYVIRGIVTKVELLAVPMGKTDAAQPRSRVTVAHASGYEFTAPWGLADPPVLGSEAVIACEADIEEAP